MLNISLFFTVLKYNNKLKLRTFFKHNWEIALNYKSLNFGIKQLKFSDENNICRKALVLDDALTNWETTNY